MNNILYLAIPGEAATVNQPALTEALAKYTTQSVDAGHWLVKTNAQPTDFVNAIRQALGGVTPIIFRLDQQALGSAILPDTMKRFVTGNVSAVA